MHDLRNSVERRYPTAAVRTQIGFMAKLTVGSEQGVPTLVVHGTADRILPIDATARLLPDLNTDMTVVEVDGAPHGLAWTHPAEVNQAILAFLEN